jgi:NAD(P)-dependent dehydrogenase (short-subunit alcohol dehydrogenase family)
MDAFADKIAVISGAGGGIGRELARLLSADGCHVALCDVREDGLLETASLCEAGALTGTRITTHVCDVSDEAAVLAFRDGVVVEHETDHVHLVFNNAGIAGGGSFLKDPREDWDRTVAVCWNGIYNCTRAFMPLLVAADEAHLVNTSSINGFWACLGPSQPWTAYSAAKFAVKGFSEALVTDLRLHAPHVLVSVVMPGHVGTDMAVNSRAVLGRRPSATVNEVSAELRKAAPTTAEQAAGIILEAVKARRWRILVGEDAELLDQFVRETPDEAYEAGFADHMRAEGVLKSFLG